MFVNRLQKPSAKPTGDRSLVALTAIILALAAVIALASRSSDQSADGPQRLILEEQPALHVVSHGAAQTFGRSNVHLKRPIQKGKLAKQQLAEAFSSYNKKTGYLINRLPIHP